MADVLARIVARKRVEVAERLGGRIVAAEPTTRSLRAAVARPGARFIMEVKRASPSGHRSSVSVEQAARAYAPIADAISVLTDAEDFGGSLADIATVRALFDGPILAKDFIVAPEQVAEARAAGADAVLVMMSVLDDATARAVIGEADRLAMDYIVEVHDEAELARAVALGAPIIGINNRDLKTLTTDLAVTERLAPLIREGILRISESGVATRADLERLAPHVDAFLVGSSLMAAPDVAEAARALVYGRIKLCGLTNADDVRLAASAGATHAGLIMVPGTPRALTLDEARPLAAFARELGLKPVGVFRDAPLDAVAGAAASLMLPVVQMHGQEDAAYVRALRERLAVGTEIWGVAEVADGSAPQRAEVDRTLFDRSKGSTDALPLSALTAHPAIDTAFVAGGLDPSNIRAAARVGAYGLDLCSGVEFAPGTKDPAKIQSLFAALRPAVREEIR